LLSIEFIAFVTTAKITHYQLKADLIQKIQKKIDLTI